MLFFIHLERWRICLAGVTFHPDQEWMEQMARNVTMEDSGLLINRKYLLHDRDSKYCSSFRQMIEAGSVKTLASPARSPNLNADAERWVRSVKEECLGKLILLGEGSLRRALRHYEAHYHEERNHQGKDNVLLFALPTQAVSGEEERYGVGSGWGPAEVLREGSGIKVDGTAGHGLTISTYYIKDSGTLPWQMTSRA